MIMSPSKKKKPNDEQKKCCIVKENGCSRPDPTRHLHYCTVHYYRGSSPGAVHMQNLHQSCFPELEESTEKVRGAGLTDWLNQIKKSEKEKKKERHNEIYEVLRTQLKRKNCTATQS